MAERTNVYEAMIIFDSNRYARERAALPAEIEKSIQEGAGEVLVSRLWEERRLAYPIAGQRKGAYWLIYFRGPSSMLTALNRQWELHEGILRHLVLKVHPHLVEAVLDHAKAGPAQPVAVAAAATHTEEDDESVDEDSDE
ncbi:MAG TPA: 30S ribosomal protein S6 [Lacipirellulaceae bacterium]|nr:30S ribosomal protein S6 [Lacipirellulaceae bacterium]